MHVGTGFHSARDLNPSINDVFMIPVTITDGKLSFSIDNTKNGANWHTFKFFSISDMTANDVVFEDNMNHPWGLISNTGYQNQNELNNSSSIEGNSFENWTSRDVNNSNYVGTRQGKVYFNIPALNRKYKVELQVSVKEGSANDKIRFFAGDQTTPILNGLNTYSLETEVNNGILNFGVEVLSGADVNWFVIDNPKVRLVEQVSLATAQAALDGATYANVQGSERANLQAAVNEGNLNNVGDAYVAFTDAAPSYNAWATEKAVLTNVNIDYASATVKTDVANMLAFAPNTAAEALAKSNEAKALIPTAKFSNARAEGSAFDVKPAIVNPNAANGTTGWTYQYLYEGSWNYGQLSNEAPDAKWGVSKYFDYYGSKYGAIFHQTVACEPGVYRLAAFMRGSENAFAEFSLQATAGKSILAPVTELVKANATTIGNTGGYFGRGWDIYYVDVVVPTNSVSIATKVVSENTGKWLGFSNFTLVKIADVTPEQNAAFADQIIPTAQAALNDAQYANVTGSERKALEDAIAAKNVLTIESAFPTFTAAKGSYDAFANYKASVETKAASFEFATEDKKQTLDNALAVMPASAAEAADAVQPAKDAFIAALLSDMVYEGVASREEIAVVNPNCNGTIEGWTDGLFPGSANNGAMRQNGPDGCSDIVNMNKYFDTNRWEDANWGTNFTQTFSFLKMGKYRLSAIMRGAAGGFEVYRLAAAADSILPTDGSAPHVDVDVTAEGLLSSNGFNPYFVEFDVPVNGPVTIGVQALANAKYRWLSFGDVKLVKFDKTTTGVETVATEAEAAEYFDLNGRRVNAANLAHGIYILRQGNKVSKVIR